MHSTPSQPPRCFLFPRPTKVYYILVACIQSPRCILPATPGVQGLPCGRGWSARLALREFADIRKASLALRSRGDSQGKPCTPKSRGFARQALHSNRLAVRNHPANPATGILRNSGIVWLMPPCRDDRTIHGSWNKHTALNLSHSHA